MKMTSKEIHDNIAELASITGDSNLQQYLLPRVGDTVVMTRKSDGVVLSPTFFIVITDITESCFLTNVCDDEGKLIYTSFYRHEDVNCEVVYNRRDKRELVLLCLSNLLNYNL